MALSGVRSSWLGLVLSGAQRLGSLGHHRLELVGQEPLTAQHLRGGDGAGCAGGKRCQMLHVVRAERGASFHSVEVEPADDRVLGDHRDHRRLSDAPAPHVAGLVRRESGRQMIGVDGDDDRTPLAQHLLPHARLVEVDRHAEQRSRIFHDLRIRVECGHRFDLPAIRRKEDNGAEVARGTRDVLGDKAEKRLDVGHRVAESIGCRCDEGQAVV